MNKTEIREQVIDLIEDKIGVDRNRITPGADIERNLGCTGDDFHELMEDYAKRFNVDMTGYLWYFHTDDESMATLDPIPGNPPSRQVERIPVTLNLLIEKAIQGRWDMTYPAHVLQPRHTAMEKVMRWMFMAILVFIIAKSCL